MQFNKLGYTRLHLEQNKNNLDMCNNIPDVSNNNISLLHNQENKRTLVQQILPQ